MTNEEEAGTTLGDLVGGDDPGSSWPISGSRLASGMRSCHPREQRILALRFHGNLTQSRSRDGSGCPRCTCRRLLTKSLATLAPQLARPRSGRTASTSAQAGR